MKLTIDTDDQTLTVVRDNDIQTLDLYGVEAFGMLSRQWLKSAWVQKYSYMFTWLGRPIIQLPEDLLKIQEVIYRAHPDIIIETGVAHGGSLVFYAGLCKIMGTGRVIGIDIKIHRHNRAAIEDHPLKPYITLIEGDSASASTIEHVKALIRPDDRVMVLLDSNHSYDHVALELRAYADIVTPGSYLLVQDGIMCDLWDVPGGDPAWACDNPTRAVADFVAERPDYMIESPPWVFNESLVQEGLTHWPSGWLKRHARASGEPEA
jgi:cephalosporin hydroxylase